jgi:hypothetical protein
LEGLQKVPGGCGWPRAFLTEPQGGALSLARGPHVPSVSHGSVGQDTGFWYSAVNPAHGADVVAMFHRRVARGLRYGADHRETGARG